MNLNEQLAEKAFSAQSSIFDNIYAGNTIVQYKRDRVRKHVLKYLKAGNAILELNSGTGEDALFFANAGHHVHATDISAGMEQQLKNKIVAAAITDKVSHERCSFTGLHQLNNKGPYDLIFSNFAGFKLYR